MCPHQLTTHDLEITIGGGLNQTMSDRGYYC
jgi:hypothetical protein